LEAKKYFVSISLQFSFSFKRNFLDPTHIFFLSPRSMYLVAFNGVERDALKRVKYWVSKISAATEGTFPPPVVVLVGTHCRSEQFDGSSCAEWAQKHRVKFVAFVDSKFGDGFDDLSKTMGTAALNAGLANKRVPAYYKLAADFLGARAEEPIWTWDRFCVVATYFAISLDDCLTLTRFLHDSGHVIFLEQSNLANSLVVLDPQWLADRMSDIVSFKHNWTMGVVDKKTLQFVWGKQSVHHIVQENLIKIFMSVGIFFQKPGSDGMAFIVPTMLPTERAVDTLTTKYICARDFVLGVLPLGLFGRIQVRIISEPDIIVLSVWRDGIVFSKNGLQGFVGLHLGDSSPRIMIRLENANVLMAFLVETVETLTKSVFTKFESQIERQVPCCHCLKADLDHPVLFSYQECAEAAKNGVLNMKCDEISVPLADLAPDIVMQHVPLILGLVLEEIIGQGGFGRVFRGSMPDGVIVAAKELSSNRSENIEEQYRELQHEIMMISQLCHENLVKFFGITTNPVRVVMEFCFLPDLSKQLHSESLLPPSLFTSLLKMKIALDIAKGMNYLHSQIPCIMHRDLRSPNVFIMSMDENASTNAKVGDFGLAVHVVSNALEFLNTWQWVAPEILSGKCYNEKVDVYSFGVVLWEIVTRQFPFEEFHQYLSTVTDWVEFSEDGTQIAKKGRKELWKEQDIRKAIIDENLRPTVPRDCLFKDFVASCWHRDPEKRPSFRECVMYFSNCLNMKVELSERKSVFCDVKRLVTLAVLDFDCACAVEIDGVFVFGRTSLPPVVLADEKKSSKRSSLVKSLSSLSVLPGRSPFAVYSGNWECLETPLDSSVNAVCVMTDDSTVWSVDHFGQIWVWDLAVHKNRSMKLSKKWKAHDNSITSICEVDNNVFTGDVQGCIRIWDRKSRKMISQKNIEGPVSCMCRWGKLLLVGSIGFVYSFDGKVLKSWKFAGPVLSFCAAGDELWCAGTKGLVVFDLAYFPPQVVDVLDPVAIVQSLVANASMSRDILVYSGSQQGDFSCWSANSRKKIWSIHNERPIVKVLGGKQAIAITDDKRIVTVV
jgi:serine/threonine protein kinase